MMPVCIQMFCGYLLICLSKMFCDHVCNACLDVEGIVSYVVRTVSAYAQEIPQSHTADQPTAPR